MSIVTSLLTKVNYAGSMPTSASTLKTSLVGPEMVEKDRVFTQMQLENVKLEHVQESLKTQPGQVEVAWTWYFVIPQNLL
jgi:hypothetical protein